MSDTKEPKPRYVKASRNRVVQNYIDKMGAVGIVSVRVSVPAALSADYAARAEQDRADYFVELAENTDDKETLELLAKSNRVKLLSHEEVERLKSTFPDAVKGEAEAAVRQYQETVTKMLNFDNNAALAENTGDLDAALRWRALTFAWSCYVRIAKQKLSAFDK